jgi:hypothetical protein
MKTCIDPSHGRTVQEWKILGVQWTAWILVMVIALAVTLQPLVAHDVSIGCERVRAALWGRALSHAHYKYIGLEL